VSRTIANSKTFFGLIFISAMYVSVSLANAQTMSYTGAREYVYGNENPERIPISLSYRVFLENNSVILNSGKSGAITYLQSQLDFDLITSQSLVEIAQIIYEYDDLRSDEFNNEICDQELFEFHTKKTIENFLDYLESKQSEIDSELIRDFDELLFSNLSYERSHIFKDWITTTITPTITHIEYDRLREFRELGVTPSSFIDGFCKMEH